MPWVMILGLPARGGSADDPQGTPICFHSSGRARKAGFTLVCSIPSDTLLYPFTFHHSVFQQFSVHTLTTSTNLIGIVTTNPPLYSDYILIKIYNNKKTIQVITKTSCI
jgi:hypothetical protein